MTWSPKLDSLEAKLLHMLVEINDIKIDHALERDFLNSADLKLDIIKKELHNLTDRLARIENLLGIAENKF